MVYNGLKGSDHAVYNYLLEHAPARRVSMAEISHQTCYCYTTVFNSVRRLESWGLISKKSPRQGIAHKFEVNE